MHKYLIRIIEIGDTLKIKHIIALCLVLLIVMPTTAFAATNTATAKNSPVKIIVTKPSSMAARAAYTCGPGIKEVSHTFYFGDGFSCHCKHRTHKYQKHGTYKVKIVLKATNGKTYTDYKVIKV
jgi:hypothetical protein